MGAQEGIGALVSVAACLTAQALTIGYPPVAGPGVTALEPDRLAHVSGTYMSAETFSLAIAPLIDAQAGTSPHSAWRVVSFTRFELQAAWVSH